MEMHIGLVWNGKENGTSPTMLFRVYRVKGQGGLGK